jgi:cbb3-type cytochrome oxidase subunit 3
MKAICYFSVGVIYAFEAAVGHGVVYSMLGFLYGVIAYAEWTHVRKDKDGSHGG